MDTIEQPTANFLVKSAYSASGGLQQLSSLCAGLRDQPMERVWSCQTPLQISRINELLSIWRRRPLQTQYWCYTSLPSSIFHVGIHQSKISRIALLSMALLLFMKRRKAVLKSNQNGVDGRYCTLPTRMRTVTRWRSCTDQIDVKRRSLISFFLSFAYI